MLAESRSKLLIKKLLIFVVLFPTFSCSGQLDVERFRDSAHHWYDIHDQKRIIEPLTDAPKYSAHEINSIADNIILFQKDNGGWAKNYDMQAILSKDQIKKVLFDKNNLNTTFDNGATHSHLTYLAEAYSITNDEKYKEAFLKGLEYIFSAQYKNGGWPQKYPDTSGYQKHITFNDGAMMGVIKLVYDITNKNPNYLFLSEELVSKSTIAFEKGVECILNMQIVEDGKMSVWCQQHDHITLKPQNARTFEPAAICNMESADLILFLMEIDNPNERIKNAIKSAVKWFEESAISGIRVDKVKAEEVDFQYHNSKWDRFVVEDENAPRIWARFNELETHVPLFCRRDGNKVYTLAEVERERRTGYAFYHYAPESVLREYPNWLERNNL